MAVMAITAIHRAPHIRLAATAMTHMAIAAVLIARNTLVAAALMGLTAVTTIRIVPATQARATHTVLVATVATTITNKC